MTFVILAVIAIFVYFKISNHVENSIQRMEGQIKRAQKRDNPPDENNI